MSSKPLRADATDYDLLIVASSNPSIILRYNNLQTKFYHGNLLAANKNDSLDWLTAMAIGPDGTLFVADFYRDRVLGFGPRTSDYAADFIPPGGGGLSEPSALIMGSDGRLYVASQKTASVKRYDATTGAFIDDFVTEGSGNLASPTALAFGPDGNLYVGGGGGIRRYDGETGAFLNYAVLPNANGEPLVLSMAFGPDGLLYAVCQIPGPPNYVLPAELRRYDVSAGTLQSVVISTDQLGVYPLVASPFPAFGPDGTLYLSSDGAVWIVDPTKNALTRKFIIAPTDATGRQIGYLGALLFVPSGLDFHVRSRSVAFNLDVRSSGALVADGSSAATLVVTATKQAGGPASGLQVILGVSGDENSIVQPGSTDSSGVAKGSFVTTQAGDKIVTAYIKDNGRMLPVASSNLTYHAGTPIHLVLLNQPGGALTRDPIQPGIQVGAADAYGNVSSDPLTVAATLANHPTGAILSGTTSVASHSYPYALFDNLRLDQPGEGYSIAFSAPGLASVATRSFAVQPESSFNLLGPYQNGLLLIDGSTGLAAGNLVSDDENFDGDQAAFAPDGTLFVIQETGRKITRYTSDGTPFPDFIDLTTLSDNAQFLPDPPSGGNIGGDQIKQILFGPDGDLYLNVARQYRQPNAASSVNQRIVKKFDPKSGLFLGDVSEENVNNPQAARFLLFGPDGALFIIDLNAHEAARYDPATGALINRFSMTVSMPYSITVGQAADFGPDGNLYVADYNGGTINRYNPNTGESLGVFVPKGSGGLTHPSIIAFGPDGNFYVMNDPDALSVNRLVSLKRYDGLTGTYRDAFISWAFAPSTLTFTQFPPIVLPSGPPAAIPLDFIAEPGRPRGFVLRTSDPKTLTAYEVLDRPEHGTLSGKPPYLVYAPDSDYSGSDHLTYRIKTATTTSDPATVSFEVAAPAPALQIRSDPTAPQGTVGFVLRSVHPLTDAVQLDFTFEAEGSGALALHPAYVLGSDTATWKISQDALNPWHVTLSGATDVAGPAEFLKIRIPASEAASPQGVLRLSASAFDMKDPDRKEWNRPELVAPGQAAVATAIKGDLNGNGKADIRDVILLLRIMIGLVSMPSGWASLNADANCDGRISIKDVTLILDQVILGTPLTCS